MSTQIIDTVIIGAGISGLACAKKFQENDRKFLIISENIGGRILTSRNGTANYGAFFVCSDYTHVLQHVTIKTRIKLSDFCFHNNTSYVLFSPTLILYSYQFMKILKLLYTFRKHLRHFRKISENISQKSSIENDHFLYKLYMQNASDFVKEQKMEKGTKKYLSQALYSTTFSQIRNMNAFSFLEFLLPLITPIYTFKFEKEKMIEPFKDKIVNSFVKELKYKNKIYEIKFDENSIHAKNVVLATEINWSKNFAEVKKVNKPISTNMLHIKGVPAVNYSSKVYHLFTPPNNVQAIANLNDGTYLLYYKNERPNLNVYFKDPEIIAHHFWNPAGTIDGHNLIESNRGKNLFLIGDYNVAGLEESYITGIFAANQIINKK